MTATFLPPRPSHLSSLSIISLWPSWCTPATSPLLSATGPNRWLVVARRLERRCYAATESSIRSSGFGFPTSLSTNLIMGGSPVRWQFKFPFRLRYERGDRKSCIGARSLHQPSGQSGLLHTPPLSLSPIQRLPDNSLSSSSQSGESGSTKYFHTSSYVSTPQMSKTLPLIWVCNNLEMLCTSQSFLSHISPGF